MFAVSTTPAGFFWGFRVSPEHRHWPVVALSSFITHAALIAWYISRFGRVASLESRSPKPVERTSTIANWLGRPRQSRFTAIAWKQFRESLPIVAAGLAGVVGIVTLFVLGDTRLFIQSPERLSELFSGASISLGFGIAMIVGIGVCLQDVTPGINSFWRSRPINPDAWFWTKYITGLLRVTDRDLPSAPGNSIRAASRPVARCRRRIGANYASHAHGDLRRRGGHDVPRATSGVRGDLEHFARLCGSAPRISLWFVASLMGIVQSCATALVGTNEPANCVWNAAQLRYEHNHRLACDAIRLGAEVALLKETGR